MPDDTTPHGGEAMHSPPDRATIPEPKPDGKQDEFPRGDPTGAARKVIDRPALPPHPEIMAADIEDEEADPVVESGPGVDEVTGKPSVTQQPAK